MKAHFDLKITANYETRTAEIFPLQFCGRADRIPADRL